MDTFEDKVAVVTGGASGIGLAMARRFGSAGARVAVADVEAAAMAAAVESLEADGIEAIGVHTDVSDGDAVEHLRDAVLDRFGGVHVVCNNAGVGSGGAMATLTTADWEWCLGVNLWGVIHGIRVFLPGLLAQGEGHIVNTASMAGLASTPFMGPYNASKFAVVTISETLRLEMAIGQTGVGVSVLCPSWVATRIHESARNRPEALQNPELATEGPPGVDVASVISGLISSGMPPEEVADQVAAAVLSDRFYILTHDSTLSAVEKRTAAILEGGEPPFVVPD